MFSVIGDDERAILHISLNGYLTDKEMQMLLKEVDIKRKEFTTSFMAFITLSDLSADRLFTEHIDPEIFSGKLKSVRKVVIYVEDDNELTHSLALRLQETYSESHVLCMLFFTKHEAYSELGINWHKYEKQ